MRKHVIEPPRISLDIQTQLDAREWLDVETFAAVEISSEHPDFPIEGALVLGPQGKGWRAGSVGPQTILLRFDTPRAIQRVLLRFVEQEHERAQEFSLKWAAAGQSGEVVRQQWTFSPGGSTVEQELYTLELPPLSELRLDIDPDRGQDRYPATLAAWRLG